MFPQGFWGTSLFRAFWCVCVCVRMCSDLKYMPARPVPHRLTVRFRSIGGAVLVNPWNTTELTEQMIGAINMEANEREIR